MMLFRVTLCFIFEKRERYDVADVCLAVAGAGLDLHGGIEELLV